MTQQLVNVFGALTVEATATPSTSIEALVGELGLDSFSLLPVEHVLLSRMTAIVRSTPY
jgi:hypothetical protein